jgi:hypothetical protein
MEQPTPIQENYPTFLVIGAMKAATSTVCAYLEDHPEVYCVPNCEPNYFSHDHNYEKGLEWYLQFFSESKDYKNRGEGSNFYSARALYPHAAERIYALNPGIKIIYMVRHPIKRIISAWIQRRSDSGDSVPPTVDAAVIEMPDEFIGQSQYYYNIQPYIDLFPRDSLFIGFMEDLGANREVFFHQLCNFLGVEYASIQRGHVNPSSGKKIPNQLYTKFNKSQIFRSAKTLAPKGLKKAVKRTMMKDASSRDISLSPAVLSDVLTVLESDSRAILNYAGKPQEFWSLTDN